jgi:Leucine-rich repeat (LRR) protein
MRKSFPLPPLETPEDVNKSRANHSSQVHRRSQYAHLMATPQTRRLPQIESPYLEPKNSLRLSISPPPADLSFAQTPRQDISFSVTTRVLVKHLTDFEPFEPYWENLRYIDFRNQGLTSLDGLKSFCPKVEEIDIKDCKVKYLTGLPSSMRVLKANGNRLGGLVSFAWGKNLQYLDLANNEIDSLAGESSALH